jgi:hypothetical protein
VGSEAAEDHGVDRAEPGTRKHPNHGFGDHRHVVHDGVARSDAQAQQAAGEPRDLVEELAVGDAALLPCDGAVVHERHLVGPSPDDVAVEGVEASVQDAVAEPSVDRCIRVIQNAGPWVDPVDGLGRVAPEALGILEALPMGLRV